MTNLYKVRHVDVLTEITINCDLASVSRYAADPENATRWYANIGSVEWKTSKPLRAGSQIAFSARFLGRRLAYTYEVVDHVPGEKMVMRTAEGPFPMTTVYSWERVSATVTRMRLRNAGVASGFSILLTPFIAFAIRKANTRDLRRLKTLLEEQV